MPTFGHLGRILYYEDQGSGTPLVFLSGLGGDHRAFAACTRHFAHSYRVLTLDHRDVGRSSRVDEAYSTTDMASDVAEWFDYLRITAAHVVGHSLGGLVAQELALGFPTKVRSLVLASTHAGANAWRQALIHAWVVARTQNRPEEFTTVTLPWLVAPKFYENPGQVQGMIRFAESNVFAQDSQAFARQARAAAEHDSRNRLNQIRVPTLVMVGELDLVNPPSVAQELAALIDRAELTILPNVGHLPHIEDGLNFRQRIGDFLEKCDRFLNNTSCEEVLR